MVNYWRFCDLFNKSTLENIIIVINRFWPFCQRQLNLAAMRNIKEDINYKKKQRSVSEENNNARLKRQLTFEKRQTMSTQHEKPKGKSRSDPNTYPNFYLPWMTFFTQIQNLISQFLTFFFYFFFLFCSMEDLHPSVCWVFHVCALPHIFGSLARLSHRDQ